MFTPGCEGEGRQEGLYQILERGCSSWRKVSQATRVASSDLTPDGLCEVKFFGENVCTARPPARGGKFAAEESGLEELVLLSDCKTRWIESLIEILVDRKIREYCGVPRHV